VPHAPRPLHGLLAKVYAEDLRPRYALAPLGW